MAFVKKIAQRRQVFYREKVYFALISRSGLFENSGCLFSVARNAARSRADPEPQEIREMHFSISGTPCNSCSQCVAHAAGIFQ